MYGNKGPEKHTKMNFFQIKITGIAVKKTDTFTMLLKSLSTTLSSHSNLRKNKLRSLSHSASNSIRTKKLWKCICEIVLNVFWQTTFLMEKVGWKIMSFAVLEVSSDFKIPDIQTINYSVCLVGLIRLLQKSLLKFWIKTIKHEYCLRKGLNTALLKKVETREKKSKKNPPPTEL